MKKRLDKRLVELRLVSTRSQAESYIKLGAVKVNNQLVQKPGFLVTDNDKVALLADQQYVSRAGLKLASVAKSLGLNFKQKIVLDVGSSTGGFTDYALQHGASRVIAVDVGTNQMHPSIKVNPKVELHEQTDIRHIKALTDRPDIVLIDVSFISLREVLPDIAKLVGSKAQIVAMVKPQFEAGRQQINRGVVKNDKQRRDILKQFEAWAKKLFIVLDKADSEVSGAKGNKERFYLLKKL